MAVVLLVQIIIAQFDLILAIEYDDTAQTPIRR